MYMWGAGELLGEDALLTNLKNLHDERGIFDSLRCHFRKLLLSELLSGPGARPPSSMSIRSRAMGSLFVEWLRSLDCHYTICMLTSELPSLTDLPEIINVNSSEKVKIKDVKEILNAVQLTNHEIQEIYEKSSDTLLSSILKAAEAWQKRLVFKEPHIIDDETVPKWASQLRNLLASFAINSSQLPRLQNTLCRMFQKIVEDSNNEVREAFQAHLLARERNLQGFVKLHETKVNSRLKEIEYELLETEEKDKLQLTAIKDLLVKLLSEIKEQHQSVLEGLKFLEDQEADLDARAALVEKENRRLESVAEGLKLKSNLIEEDKRKVTNILTHLEDMKKRTQTALLSDRFVQTDHWDPPQVVCCKCTSLIPQPKQVPNGNVKPNLIVSPAIQDKTVSSISHSCSTMTSSSEESGSESNNVNSATWKRLLELRGESKQTREAILAQKNVIDDSESSSTEDIPQYQSMLGHLQSLQSRPPGSLMKPQVSFPHRYEGCNPGVASPRNPSPRRTPRPLHTGQGDHAYEKETLHINNSLLPTVNHKDKLKYKLTASANISKGFQKIEHIMESVRTEGNDDKEDSRSIESSVSDTKTSRSALPTSERRKDTRKVRSPVSNMIESARAKSTYRAAMSKQVFITNRSSNISNLSASRSAETSRYGDKPVREHSLHLQTPASDDSATTESQPISAGTGTTSSKDLW